MLALVVLSLCQLALVQAVPVAGCLFPRALARARTRAVAAFSCLLELVVSLVVMLQSPLAKVPLVLVAPLHSQAARAPRMRVAVFSSFPRTVVAAAAFVLTVARRAAVALAPCR